MTKWLFCETGNEVAWIWMIIQTCISQGKLLNETITKDVPPLSMENIPPGVIYRTTEVRISGAKHKPPSLSDMYRRVGGGTVG